MDAPRELTIDETLISSEWLSKRDLKQLNESSESFQSIPGPDVNGRKTTLVSLSPEQLARSSLERSISDVINTAFSTKNIHKGGPRLTYQGQLSEELSRAADSITYALYYAGTNQVVGTASARRYFDKVIPEGDPDEFQRRDQNMWHRFGVVPAGAAAWEMCTMAVDPTLQKQGLASYMMKAVEDGIKLSFKMLRKEAKEMGEIPPSRLLIMVTTSKERNGAFYSRRGFVLDYQTRYEPGTWGSESGFTVLNLSKTVEIDDDIEA